jgi:hypothetical protein
MNKDNRDTVKQDAFLGSLVMLANSGMEIGITLNVRGTAISGVLISGETYFNELAGQFSSSPQAGLKDTFMKILKNNADRFQTSIEEDKKNHTIRPPHYIHLKNCCFMNAGSDSSSKKLLWRGLISSIDGFSVENQAADK